MQSLEASKKMFGGAHTSTACLTHCLAVTYSDLGRYADALPLHTEVLGRLRITYGDENPSNGEYGLPVYLPYVSRRL
jgi:hypothetical protein